MYFIIAVESFCSTLKVTYWHITSHSSGLIICVLATWFWTMMCWI